jgi:hypothetical protein
MNDRLAELQADVPSWAKHDGNDDYDGDGDVELGNHSNGNNHGSNRENNGNAHEEFSWAQGDTADSSGNVNNPASQPEHMKQFFNDVEAIKGDKIGRAHV